MERVTVEQNGERITLEVPDGTTDDQIQQFLGGSKATPEQPKEPAPVIPAVGAYPTGPVGVNTQAIKQAVSPFVESLGLDKTAGIYKANPILAPAVEALGLTTVGVPPIAASQGVLGLYDRYKGAVGSAKEASKIVSQTPMVESPVNPGVEYPSGVPAFNEMKRLAPELTGKLQDLYHNQGGPNAVRAWLNSPEAAQYMKDPRFAAAANEYLGHVPTKMEQVGKVLAPVGRVAGKALGALGIGIEGAQGINQLSQGDYTGAGISGLGVASMLNPLGIVAQPGLAIMGAANRNFRQQTPQQQRESAMDALSGTAPGMAGEYFPQYSSEDNITQAIRRKAAQKVLGPVAPQ